MIKVKLERLMKAQGIIKGKNIVLKKLPADKKLTEGARVEVIILPLKSLKSSFRKEVINEAHSNY